MLPSSIGTTHNWTLAELRIFCLICDLRSFSQVALRLEVSQSAVSQMVQRWRRAIGDPLFTRSRYGVVPTQAAIDLCRSVQPLLDSLAAALARPVEFDPANASRLFKIHMSDTSQLVFLPKLTTLLNVKAPCMRLVVHHLGWDEVEKGLVAGDIDLAVGSLPMIKGRVHSRTLLRQRFVTVMRARHPLAEAGLDLDSFAAAEHLVVDAASSGNGIVEGALRALGIQRKIGLSIPHHLAVEPILAAGEYVLTLPEGGLCAIRQPDLFRVSPVPFELPSFDIRLHWHERSQRDAGIRWLRAVMCELFGAT